MLMLEQCTCDFFILCHFFFSHWLLCVFISSHSAKTKPKHARNSVGLVTQKIHYYSLLLTPFKSNKCFGFTVQGPVLRTSLTPLAGFDVA